MDANQLKILVLSSEVAPLVKTDGVADVVGALAKALKALGHDVRVAMPRYSQLDTSPSQPLLSSFPVSLDSGNEEASIAQGELEGGVPVYFVENARFFNREGLYMYPDDAERFIFFCRAALEMLPRLNWQPDIIHCNDWQTAIVPNWLRTIYAASPFFERTATVYTIHNLAYQGIFGQRVLELAGLAQFGFIAHPEVPREINDVFDFMARGILFADAVNTVSPTYAREIQTPEFGEKLDAILRQRGSRLRGILNGIDYEAANPAADPALARSFDADHLESRLENKRALQKQAGLVEDVRIPLLCMISRLTDVQGLDILSQVIDHILDLGVQFILVGSGDQHYHKVFSDLEGRYPGRVKFYLTFDQTVQHQVVAGADILLMPSRFEPGGTTQLLAMHYGCVPVARRTGGLADTVLDFDPRTGEGTGFAFDTYDRWSLFAAVVRALEESRRPAEWAALRRRGLLQDFSWGAAAVRYVEMYRTALGRKLASVEREANLEREIERTAQIMANLPERLRPLRELVYNLWWSWNSDALDLFERIDPEVWERVHHNPVSLLRQVPLDRLQALVQDGDFIAHYDRVLTAFGEYMHPSGTWFESTYPYAGDGSIAYFSAEFGLHESLPIYSGGLGILSGDHTKEASDLGLPLVAVGFLYPQGYFRQQVDGDGNQIAIYDKLNFAEAPAFPARDPEGNEIMIGVEMPGRTVHVKVWQIQVGRVPIYLMDTDVEANTENDRQLAARLYGGDHEMRIMQEIMLGIGGVRILRALGLFPSTYHMNEGHSTFLILELIRELVAQGHSFEDAQRVVAARCIFTVHTPVAAGNDAFSPELMDKYFWNYYPQLGLSRDALLSFARQDSLYSMTVQGLRGSDQRNGVSKLHGQESRAIWHFLWQNRTLDQVPIGSITNGIHTATWLAPELEAWFAKCLGANWYDNLDSPARWANLKDGEAFWEIHKARKRRLVEYVRACHVRRLDRNQAAAEEIAAARSILDPEALTLGFARRFATYKRATLMFRDEQRLKRLLSQAGRPVQIIFAGKAHPADEPGKDLIRRLIRYSREPGFAGSVVFLEDYGINDARLLTSGVDLWVNNPRRPMEACGTSGQKAGLNGILNCSILDGWWPEAFNGANGWAIGDSSRAFDSPDAQDEADALALYAILEDQVVPLYYQRDENGVPREWLERCLESIRTIAPAYSTRRMVKEYVLRYLNAMMPAAEPARLAVR